MNPEDYSGMDVSDIVEEIKKVLDKYPRLNKKEIEHLRVLSNNLSVECGNALYYMAVTD